MEENNSPAQNQDSTLLQNHSPQVSTARKSPFQVIPVIAVLFILLILILGGYYVLNSKSQTVQNNTTSKASNSQATITSVVKPSNATITIKLSPSQSQSGSIIYYAVVASSAYALTQCNSNASACKICTGNALCSFSYPAGSSVEIITTSGSNWINYTFQKWQCTGTGCSNGGYSGSNSNATVTLNSNVTETAYYSSTIPQLNYSAPGALSTWTQTTSYPMNESGTSCVIYTSYVYCIGGENGYITATNGLLNPASGAAYYAQMQSSGPGIGTWTKTTTYPLNVTGANCATYSNYIYCVGGGFLGGEQNGVYLYPNNIGNSTYYAQLSSSGIGTWTKTTASPLFNPDCVTSNNYIYCLGGFSPTPSVAEPSNKTYYAQLSSSGIGAWYPTATYPANASRLEGAPSCVVNYQTIICTGESNVTYYAFLTASGIGAWSTTTSYPFAITGQNCVDYATYLYCLGGVAVKGSMSANLDRTYYTIETVQNSSSVSGVGSWTDTSNYNAILGESCFAYYGYIYCVGGFVPYAVTAPPYTFSGYSHGVFYSQVKS